MHSFTHNDYTDHFSWHAAYLPVYERLFAPLKIGSIRLLEVGTYDGGGLLMYHDFFKRGEIYGIDVNPPPDRIKGYSRITHYQGNAYSAESLAQIRRSAASENGLFDIIIDDGPHSLETQEFFVLNYSGLLTRSGLAVVEDLEDIKYAKQLTDALPKGFHSMTVDLRAINGRYDDILFVFWRH